MVWSNLEVFEVEYLVVPRIELPISSSSMSASMSSSSRWSSTSFSWSSISSSSQSQSLSSSSSTFEFPIKAQSLMDGGQDGRFFFVEEGGDVWGVGDNSYWALGDGTDQTQFRAVDTSINSPMAIATGRDSSFYITQSGVLYAIGSNLYGGLGIGSTDHAYSWSEAGINFTKVIPGYDNWVVALKVNNTAWSWGHNDNGQLGVGDTTDRSSPVQVATAILDISAGYKHALLLGIDGVVRVCGDNEYGQLGITGYGNHQSSPVSIATAQSFASVWAGYQHSLGIDDQGRVWSWGRNNSGQLGDNTDIDNDSPKIALSAKSYIQVAASAPDTSYALDSDGNLWAFGNNERGQFGDGTTANSTTPIQVTIDATVTEVRGGYQGAIALDENGNVWAWGQNDCGQLGAGERSRPDVSVPITIGRVPSISFSSVSPAEYVERLRLPSGTGSHTVVISAYKSAMGMGDNSSGQIGDGLTYTRYSPTPALGMRDYEEAAIGYAHTILRDDEGNLWASGDNSYGRLGDGTTASRSTPIAVLAGGKHFDAITCGGSHSMALENGTVWAWGYNTNGELGDGSSTSRPAPVSVKDGIVKIAAGSQHSMAIDSQGYLYIWGNGDQFRLGLMDSNNRSTPTLVAAAPWGPPRFNDMDGGDNFTVLIGEDEYIYGCGYGYYGQLANDNAQRSYPILLSGIVNDRKYQSISVGYRHTLALAKDGSLWSWGRDNIYGECGNGSSGSHVSTPVNVAPANAFIEVYAGYQTSMAVDTEGVVWAWGRNDLGQLGAGNAQSFSTPVSIARLTPTIWSSSRSSESVSSSISLSSGVLPVLPIPIGGTDGYRGGALDSLGRVWMWGSNGQGALGDGTTTQRSTPTQAAVRGVFRKVATGANHTLYLRDDGDLYGSGYNYNGELGNGGQNTIWFPVPAGSGIKFQDVDCGYNGSIGLGEDGKLYTWGSGDYGELGDGTTTSRQTLPVLVTPSTTYKDIAAGSYLRFGIDTSGNAFGWGYNYYGGLGVGDTNNRSTPTAVVGSYNFDKMDCGYIHTAAIKTDGTVMTWGYGSAGQLGNGSWSSVSSPVSISSTKEFVDVACGYSHVVALDEDGVVWAWGYGIYGQLGNSNTSSRNTPVSAVGLPRCVSLAAGYYSSSAVTYTGEVYTWGRNDFGQLGLGDTSHRSTPTLVPKIFHDWSSSSSSSSNSFSSTSHSSSSQRSSSSTARDILSGLQHRWPLDDTDQLVDVVGTKDLTNHNGVSFETYGALFDGTDQYLDATGVSLSSSFTIYFAISPMGFGAAVPVLISNSGDSTLQRAGVIVDADYDFTSHYGTDSMEFVNVWSSAYFPPSHYNSVALCYDGATLKTYRVEGAQAPILMGQKSISPQTIGDYLCIGKYGTVGTNHYEGKMRDVRIYNRSLKVEELAILHEINDVSLGLLPNTMYQFILFSDPPAPINTYRGILTRDTGYGWVLDEHYWADDGVWSLDNFEPIYHRIYTRGHILGGWGTDGSKYEHSHDLVGTDASGNDRRIMQRFQTGPESGDALMLESIEFRGEGLESNPSDLINVKIEIRAFDSPGQGILFYESTLGRSMVGPPYVFYF